MESKHISEECASTKSLPFDEALEQYVGSLGRYQLFIAILLCLVAVPNCLCSVMFLFTMGHMDHWCALPQPMDGPFANLTNNEWLNLTLPMEPAQEGGAWKRASCRAYDLETDSAGMVVGVQNSSHGACDAYGYDHSTYQSTLVSQWDLVCDKGYLVSLSLSVGLAGKSFGGAFGGISDRFGRWKTILIMMTIAPVFIVSATFSPNLIFFMVMTFIVFALEYMVYITAFTFVIELVGPKYRALISALSSEIYGASLILLAGLAYVFRRWTDLYWWLISSFILLIPIAFLVPESPRWLYARKRDSEGLKVLKMMARRNGRPEPSDINITVEKKQKEGQIGLFFSTPILLVRSVLIFYAWVVASFTYYGLTFSMGSLAGNIYVNLAVSGALDVIACIIAQVAVSSCLGRRLSTCLLYTLTGLSLLVILAVPKDMPLVATGLATFGRFCCTGFFTTVYIWTAELYPTIMRNTGISLSSAFGNVGGIVAPFVSQLAVISPVLPSVTYGISSLLAAVLLLLLPETKGQPLAQTVTELKEMLRREKKSPIPVPEAEEKFLKDESA